MSTVTFSLPKEYGYVLLAAAGTCFVSFYHSYVTGIERGLAKVAYPKAYAPTMTPPAADSKLSADDLAKQQAEYRFNCAQRAHSQYLENICTFLPALVISGLRWPVVSGALGGLWVLNRIIFVRGYVYSSKAQGKGRYNGAAYLPIQIALMGMAIKVGFDMVFA